MQGFDFDELLLKFRYPLLILLVGLCVVFSGVLIFKSGMFSSQTKIEVLPATTSGQISGNITAEVNGSVLRPGVYKLPAGSRVEDLLILSGGFSESADRVWADKYLNRAAKLTDGQKVYIPNVDQQSNVLSAKENEIYQSGSGSFSSDSNAIININTASLSQLDSLPGIGQVYGQSIIDHRPYSTVEELLSKGALKQSVYDKVKNLVAVY